MNSPTVHQPVVIDLLGFATLATVSVLVGLAINSLRRQPLPLVYQSSEERLRAAVALLKSDNANVLASSAEPVPEIELDAFQPFATGRKGMVIDARPAFVYRDGHVPGAVSLPRDDFEAAYRRLDARLASRKAETIMIYCSGADCHDADLVADALRALGFSRLLVYREGWEEWSQSGLPQEK